MDLWAEIVWLRTLNAPSPHPVPSINVKNTLISLASTRTKVCLKWTTVRPLPFHSLLCSTLKHQDFLKTACYCPTVHADGPNGHGCPPVPGETRSASWGWEAARQCSGVSRSGSSPIFGRHFKGHSYPHSFLHCPWLLFHYKGRVEKWQQKPHGPQHGKCSLSGLSQKQLADSCKTGQGACNHQSVHFICELGAFYFYLSIYLFI